MYFRNSNFKHKMKRLQTPQKLVYEVAVVKKNLLTQNCRPNFIKNLLIKKRKKNM